VPSADGIRVSFQEGGTGLPELVFVHGWSCSGDYWLHQLRHFSARHRVVAVDLAGHGDSGTGRPRWTIEAFGRDVAAVVDHLRLEEAILVGHSMGGDVVAAAATALDERVSGVVWVDTYPKLGEPISGEEARRTLARFRDDFAGAVGDLVRGFFSEGASPELVDRVVTDMSSAPPEVALGALEHAIAFEEIVLATLPRIPVPVIALNPDDGRSDAGSLKAFGVDLVLMEGMGHFAMLEDPGAFNAALDAVVRQLTAGPR
jgi:pimeloyl-ACP methyl ester carboxylesterase